MTIKTFVFNPFQVNTYVLYDDSAKCIIVDPAMDTTHEEDEILRFISETNLTPEAIVNTHCHVDHILGCIFLKSKFSIPFYAHQLEKNNLAAGIEFGKFFGLTITSLPEIDTYLDIENGFKFGNSNLQIFHVPGHSEGSIALYSETGNFVITGDALFRGSIGRTDLPGGSYHSLIQSITEKLLVLPGNTAVYPGHGPKSDIKTETDTNPFLNRRQ